MGWAGLVIGVALCLGAWPAWGAAPPRAGTPYAEALCNGPNVFFCEDFEDTATAPRPSTPFGECNGTWPNPAFVYSSYCYNAGFVAPPTVAIPGMPTPNTVYQFAILGNAGANTIDGYLRRAGAGTAYSEYYVRYQFYYSADTAFPIDLDIKQLFTHPEDFIDAPSANYQNGAALHEDYHCTGLGNFGDVLAIRYGQSYNHFPVDNEYCPPLAPGLPADNIHAPRLQVNRWYTLEMHFLLGNSSGTGLLEAWLDGNKMYQANRPTCQSTCPPMAYIFLTAYKGWGEPGGGYVQYDHLVMSTAPIGVPMPSVPVLPCP